MKTTYPRKKVNLALVTLACLGILASSSMPAQLRRDSLSVRTPNVDRVPLEAAVDSNEYVVGPGDELTICLWGAVNQIMAVPVTPEGTALIPSVGEARVGGVTLSQAKKEIRRVLSRRYATADASVTLTKIRDVKVRVAGAVVRPGVYALPAYSRVSEVIGQAGGVSDSPFRRHICL